MTYARPALLCSLLLICASAAVSTNAEDDRSDETAHLEGEAREITDWVIACQRAGWEDFDVETYLSQWAQDATVILARYEEPGEYDVTYDYDTIVATRTMRMRGENPGIVLSYVNIEVAIDADEAVMTTRTISASRGSDYREVLNERFTLRRDGDGWLVVEDRAWKVGESINGRQQIYNAAMWRAWDRMIVSSRERGDRRMLLNDYAHGYRLVEAHAMAVEVCGQDDATAGDWSTRGLFAVLVGGVEDAELSFETALEMDPEVWLPYYAVPEEEEEEEEEEED